MNAYNYQGMLGKFLFVLGWSKRQWVLFLLVLSVFIVLMLVAQVTGLADSRLNNWLLLLSGIVLLLYTVETQGLRLEMVRQNDLAIQPIVIATIEPNKGQRTELMGAECMELRNIGRGTALHIKVEDIEFEKLAIGGLVCRFEQIDYLEAGHGRAIQVEWHGEFQEGKSRPSNAISNLNPRFARNTYDARILYEDINGQRHESVVRMGKGGIRLLNPPRQVS
jgi:hypothetical protein